MTSEESFGRATTDEPDGATAYEASLRPPGESLHSTDDTGDDFADLPAEDRRSARDTSRAGYDVDAVSGTADPADGPEEIEEGRPLR
ncbi:hypothetical protein O7600_04390 [Micromonospora sp. WMMA1998]|uniref:DUF5709 domain-containing protein n=1 Tax=Micromonospora sediminicola TaxID=946078 RepID=A0A1A9BCG1_9ACTN|nr:MULTISPECIES: hypothetical protein [Micromonospora]ATO13011.1 hypothetical protein CO540_03515 [Micromonospora sp. WMMA2032]PGH44762.1 hypothetical protein COO58_10225 [Micromonospora sp. WMMA1996]WBC16086.1 hypothetical protein O7600_04390 [Micromonospora sp. WMMA1998]SBT66567.1 hypothetical protein GA0070622_3590 [Micromonospora sediminicola]